MKRNMKLMEDVIRLYNKVEDLYTNISNKLKDTHDFDGVYGIDGLYCKDMYVKFLRYHVGSAFDCIIDNNTTDIQSVKHHLYKAVRKTNDMYRVYKESDLDSDKTTDPLYLYNILKDIRNDLLCMDELRVDKSIPSINISNQECIKINMSLKDINYKSTKVLFEYIQKIGLIKDFNIRVFYIYDSYYSDRDDIAISISVYEEYAGDLVRILNTFTRYSYINSYNTYMCGWDFEKLGKRIRNKMNISRIRESNINIFHTVEWLFNSVVYGTPDPMEILE